jgi:hypothetical protein
MNEWDEERDEEEEPAKALPEGEIYRKRGLAHIQELRAQLKEAR